VLVGALGSVAPMTVWLQVLLPVTPQNLSYSLHEAGGW